MLVRSPLFDDPMQFLIPLCSAHSIPRCLLRRPSVRPSVLPVIPESGAQLNRPSDGRTDDRARGRAGGPAERPKGDEDDSLLVVAVPHERPGLVRGIDLGWVKLC